MSSGVAGGAHRVRFAAPGDAEAIAGIYAPCVRDTAISFETEPPSPDEIRGRIAAVTAAHPWLVADEAGRVSGYAYASRHRDRAAYRWSVDVSVYVAPDRHRRGTATRLYRALFALLVDQGFVNACAGITLPNPPSVGFHERMGFRPVGVYRGVGFKLGAWHDVGWWQLALAAPPADPPPPKTVADVLRERGPDAAARYGVVMP